jgi:hypothetical protein
LIIELWRERYTPSTYRPTEESTPKLFEVELIPRIENVDVVAV